MNDLQRYTKKGQFLNKQPDVDFHANDYYFEATMSSTNKFFKNGLRNENNSEFSKTQSGGAPPNFYEKDQEKWTAKFSKSNSERKAFKASNKPYEGTLDMFKYTMTDSIKGDADINKVLKRRNSRFSKNNFNDVDFEYLGNTNTVSSDDLLV
jgi:cytochrome c1